MEEMQEQNVSLEKRTLTQRVLDHLGTRTAVAELIEARAGFRITRQAIGKWYDNGALPFQGADLYARILSYEARKQSFDVTKDDLLREVQVPAHRMPKQNCNA
jgi:hypothetical protein